MADPHPSSPPVAAPGPPPGASAAGAPQRWRRRFGGTAGSTGYFVIVFTAFLLTLLWSAVAYQINHDGDAMVETAQVNNSNLARAYAEHVNGVLQLVDQALQRIKNEYENQSTNPEFLLRLMNDSSIDARTVPIGITDASGKIVASNLGLVFHNHLPPTASSAAKYAGDRDYFNAHIGEDSGKVYVSTPIISRITGQSALALSRRLNKPDGSFAGVVFASFDPNFLSGFFSDLAIGKNSSFAIIGRDMVIRDMIRGSGRATDLVGKTVPSAYLVTVAERVPNGDYDAVSSLDHVERLYSYRTLANYGLIVVASVARPDILAGFDERRAWMLCAGAALSLIFIAAAAFQLRRIAQTRQYEIALNRSNEKLGRAQRLAEIGSFEHDAGTGRAEWSDEMFRILGIEKTAALPGSETLTALIHPEDRDMFRQYRACELEGQQVPTFEYRIIRPDGAERIVRRESAVVFDKEARAIRRFGTLQDITELRVAERRERELERQLLHSQKLEALGTLAGGIAHDLNNTLTPIMALSKLTARRLNPGDAVRNTLETIFAASEQARDLVQRVLAFSRRDKIEKVLTSPSKLVGDALLLLRATLPSSIQLRTAIAEVPLIFADASQIHQVVTNLVANAAQAVGEKQGTITVTLERANSSASGREMVRLSVADSGKGMDEATRRRIFEPFYTTKEVGQGTGLGLSIVEGIVNDHGGRIEVHSELGKGSRFDIFFPLPVTETSAAA